MLDLKGLKFSKMHGIGNDFPIIDESKGEVIPEKDKPEACLNHIFKIRIYVQQSYYECVNVKINIKHV